MALNHPWAAGTERDDRHSGLAIAVFSAKTRRTNESAPLLRACDAIVPPAI
jgi:hypothetical protein